MELPLLNAGAPLQLYLFIMTFCCINTPISGIIDHYCMMVNYNKNRKKKKKKLRTIYPKIHDNSKNNKPRVRFYCFL